VATCGGHNESVPDCALETHALPEVENNADHVQDAPKGNQKYC